MAKSKRFEYFQPNKLDLKDERGDCQIRALCKALDKTWIEVFDIIVPICRKYQITSVFSGGASLAKTALAELGFTYTGVSNKKGSKRPTIDEFAKAHKNGTYVVTVAHHVVCVKDGKYYDTWDSGDNCMYGYYTKGE